MELTEIAQNQMAAQQITPILAQWRQWLVKTFFRLRIAMRNKGWS
jgi:hypothetical protein